MKKRSNPTSASRAWGVPLLALLVMLVPWQVHALDWSTNEIHYQHGRLQAPTFAGGGEHSTNIITLQHASGWKYGDSFFFIDYLHDGNTDDFNDSDYYGEVYLNFSLGKILDRKVGAGALRDVGIVLGLNAGDDPKVLKYLPGIRLSWDVPGFAFLNTDITAYIDDSNGVKAGTTNAPSEGDSYMVDVSWAYPFSRGDHDFSIEGHAEYIDDRHNQFGAKVHSWVLAQPQFRYDLGKSLLGSAGHLFVGVEWQIWENKLGDANTDENTVQALVVWRL